MNDRRLPTRWAIALAALGALAALAAIVVGDNAATRFDAHLVRHLAATRSHAVVEACRLVTNLGSLTVLAPLALAAGGATWRLAPGVRRPFAPLLALSLTAVAGPLIKLAVARPRPPAELAAIVQHATGYPSGHAAQSAAALLAAALLLPRGPRRRGAIAAAAMLTAIVGASRVLLGVHSPTDVLGGWLLGIAGAVVVSGTTRERPQTP